MEIKRTNAIKTNGVKMLVYGASGVGKTTLIASMPKPIILSAEGGLLSISEIDLPYIEIATMDDLEKAYEYVTGEHCNEFLSVALDSISEIAEVVLSNERKRSKDPRQAYGEMQIQMTDLIRAFRDIPNKNVYFTAKLEKTQDELGRMLYAPSMPGNKIGQQLPFFFDEVMALRIETDAEGNRHRVLMTDSDGMWTAKDRSGKLDQWEEPNLNALIEKIRG